MDVNNRHHGGSNYRCQTCTFRFRRFHNGPCAVHVGVSFFTDHFLSGRGQRISTCVTTTETTNRISNYFCFQNHFNIGICGNPIPICRNILQQIIIWVVLKIQSIFSRRFLMYSKVEYQCFIPRKYIKVINNNPGKVSKWEYMESQKRMTMYVHD